MARSTHPDSFPFYPDDFAGDENVEAMSTVAVGAYTLLLCRAWHERPAGSLPNDDLLLARWARLDRDSWQEIRLAVMTAFTLGSDGRLHQKRMRAEYDKVMALRNARSKAGSAGARAKWQSHSKANGNANGSAIPSPSPPSHSPLLHPSPSQESPLARPHAREARLFAAAGASWDPTDAAEMLADPDFWLDRAIRGLPPVPAELSTPEFKAAWACWEREKQPSILSIRQQFTRLTAWGPARAAAAIRYSLAQSYAGIHEEKDNGNHRQKPGHRGIAEGLTL